MKGTKEQYNLLRVGLTIGIILITALLLMLSWEDLFSAEVEVRSGEEITFFFPMPKYRISQPIIPDSTRSQIVAILATNPSGIQWVGTADLDTKYYDDLAKGIEAADQPASQMTVAEMRGQEAVSIFGGTYKARVVQTEKDRGLTLTITKHATVTEVKEPVIKTRPDSGKVAFLSNFQDSLQITILTLKQQDSVKTNGQSYRQNPLLGVVLQNVGVNEIVKLASGTYTVRYTAMGDSAILYQAVEEEFDVRPGDNKYVKAEPVRKAQPKIIVQERRGALSDLSLGFQAGLGGWTVGSGRDVITPTVGILVFKGENFYFKFGGGYRWFGANDEFGDRTETQLYGSFNFFPFKQAPWLGFSLGASGFWENIEETNRFIVNAATLNLGLQGKFDVSRKTFIGVNIVLNRSRLNLYGREDLVMENGVAAWFTFNYHIGGER